MSVVVGVVDRAKTPKEKNVIYMAADSQTNIVNRTVTSPPKIVVKKFVQPTFSERMLLGTVGVGGIGMLLRYLIDDFPDPYENNFEHDPDSYANDVAYHISNLAHDHHLVRDDGAVDGTVMMGFGGRLWTLTDYLAIPHKEGIATLGAGDELAMGYLEAIRRYAPDVAPSEMVVEAVRVAEKHSPHCGGPIYVEEA